MSIGTRVEKCPCRVGKMSICTLYKTDHHFWTKADWKLKLSVKVHCDELVFKFYFTNQSWKMSMQSWKNVFFFAKQFTISTVGLDCILQRFFRDFCHFTSKSSVGCRWCRRLKDNWTQKSSNMTYCSYSHKCKISQQL